MNVFKFHKPILLLALFSLFAVFSLFATPLWAQELNLSEQQEQQIASQIELTKERLELSDEQAVAVEEILQNTFTERLLIMDKYGINPQDPNFKRPEMSTLKSMRDDMSRLDKDTRKQLDTHLSKKQMKEFKKMERERQDRMRKRMMGRG